MITFLAIIGGIAVYYMVGSVAMGLGVLVNAANNASDDPKARRVVWLFCHVFGPLALVVVAGFAVYTVIAEDSR